MYVDYILVNDLGPQGWSWAFLTVISMYIPGCMEVYEVFFLRHY